MILKMVHCNNYKCFECGSHDFTIEHINDEVYDYECHECNKITRKFRDENDEKEIGEIVLDTVKR